jgi:tripartite-type tricarboxylate transporter receptor subunit TctC
VLSFRENADGGQRMKLPRRSLLHLVAGAAALPTVSRTPWAQAYPTRPVRIVVAFPPGGANDIHARLIGQWLHERLGQPFLVENRPGSGGNLGVEAVVRSPADGYTLLILTVAHSVNKSVYEKLSYDLPRDIAPIAGLYRSQYLMMVNPRSPAKTAPEFIAHVKTNPGKINFGSNGVGATGHLAGELFKMMTGVNMLHVPYRGEAPALMDLIAGHVQVVFASMTGSLELVRSGQLRALAVTSTDRIAAVPEIPPLHEFVPGYELATWSGVGAPRNTPVEIVDRLNKEINAFLATPSTQAKYADLGLTVHAVSPPEYATFIAEDIEKWAKIVKFAGIKPI